MPLSQNFVVGHKPGELSQIVVGRYVPEKEIKNFLMDYLRKNGVWPMVLKVQIEK